MSELLHYNNIKAMLTTLKRKEKSSYKGMLAEVIELVDLCAKIAEADYDETEEIKVRIYEILS